MIFRENKIVTVHTWDRETGIYIGPEEYQTEIGFGLPSGMLLDEPVKAKGKVAVVNASKDGWGYVEDDRGRIFYNKQNGQAVKTTILGEVVDRRLYTKIAPPKITDGQLLRFVDERQEWKIGLDWYEMPVWDKDQNMSYYTGEFFIPNERMTNVEPMPHEVGFTLDENGNWVEKTQE